MPSSEKISQLSSISGSSIQAIRDFVPIVKWSQTENTGSNFKIDVNEVIDTCNSLPEITSGFLNSTSFITVANSTNTYKLSLLNLSRTSSYTRTSSLSVSSSHAVRVISTLTATTASFTTTATSSDTTTSSSYATRSRSSSYVTKAALGDTTTSSSYATRSRSSSFATFASTGTSATSASYANQARSASYAATVKSASYAVSVSTSTTSTTAISASYAANASGGGGIGGLGSDTTVNFNSSMTTAQMQALIDAQPRSLNRYTLTFQFADGTYNLTAPLYFKYFLGNLQILGNASDFTVGTSKNVVLVGVASETLGALNINCCSNPTVKGIKVNVSGTSPRGIVIYWPTYATVYYNYITRTDNSTASGTLLECWYNGFTDAYGNYFNAGAVAITAIVAAVVGSNNNISSPTNSANSTNADSGTIFRTGTQPGGTTLTQNAGATYS